jgi:phage shock protein PspC (stress-responsive transcriptional regulator)
MAVLWTFIGIGIAILVIAFIIFILMIPDLRRYMRLRRM